jgi:sugar/nucleoside kinase (ribokinase family)
MREYVLVAGAAHLDVIADYKLANQSRLDKIGQIRYAVGGTGYNITINLGQAGVPVAFLTLLKKNSFSSAWIRERLESSGVDTDFVELSPRISESGFIAIRQDGQLETAVTSSAIGEHSFPAATVDEAVKHARFVVLDCNLAGDQLSLFLESARRHEKPVAVAAVSDSKVLRLVEIGDHQQIDLVALSEHELAAVFADQPPEDKDNPARICERLKAKQVIVTAGINGYVVVTSAGGVKRYSAPQVDNIVSTTGAGDALLGAALADWYKRQSLDFDNSVASIATAIRKVLQQPGATVGSVATDIDFANLAKIAIRDKPFWGRLLSVEVGTAAGILVAILTCVLAWMAYKSLPTPDLAHSPASVPSAAQKAPPSAPQRVPTP